MIYYLVINKVRKTEKIMKNEESLITKKITYQESDFVGYYRLANLFSTLSDLATKNGRLTGIWQEELEGRYGWILTKQTIKLFRPIKINEEVTFTTRAGKSSRIKFTRLYDIFDSHGICIGGVYSTWTFIDIQKRKIIRPEIVGVNIPEIEEHKHAVEKYEEIKNTVDLELVAERVVSYSDLDINQHMNNYRYLEWALDVMDCKLFNTYYISEASVNFKKEMLVGTKAKIFYGINDLYFKVRIVSEDNSTEHFEMGGYLRKG